MLIIPVEARGINLHVPLTQRVLAGGTGLHNGGIGLQFRLGKGWYASDTLRANFAWSANTTLVSPEDDASIITVPLDSNNVAAIPDVVLEMTYGVMFVSLTAKSGVNYGTSLFTRFDIVQGIGVGVVQPAVCSGEFIATENFHYTNPFTINHALGRIPTYFYMLPVEGLTLPESGYFAIFAIHIINNGGDAISDLSASSTIKTYFNRIGASGSVYTDDSTSAVKEINSDLITIATTGSIYLVQAGTRWKWMAY